jgi:endonuclease/exonuclease/phosphatase family metal-dependent hydrolase
MLKFSLPCKRTMVTMFLAFCVYVCPVMLRAQTPFIAPAKATGYTVVFYNVENLYDTIDDPRCDDAEYLPAAADQWNTEKYNTKLAQISKVLALTDSLALPTLIGLAEIENRGVLNDLVKTKALKKGKYKIIHEDSRDPRGIDVALLYKSSQFKEITHYKIPVKYDTSEARSARECLYVCGLLGKKDTVHLIVNHWKSRSGGTEQTEAKRIFYAQTIRHMVDSLFATNSKAQIILMGDFNDNPTDSSVADVLNARPYESKLEHKQLYNLTYGIAARGEGSLYYKGWDLFDQIMVSTSLLMQKKSGIISDTEAAIFKRDWMCYTNSKGLLVPNRTYAGGKYFGGFSDHFPVTTRIYILK